MELLLSMLQTFVKRKDQGFVIIKQPETPQSKKELPATSKSWVLDDCKKG